MSVTFPDPKQAPELPKGRPRTRAAIAPGTKRQQSARSQGRQQQQDLDESLGQSPLSQLPVRSSGAKALTAPSPAPTQNVWPLADAHPRFTHLGQSNLWRVYEEFGGLCWWHMNIASLSRHLGRDRLPKQKQNLSLNVQPPSMETQGLDPCLCEYFAKSFLFFRILWFLLPKKGG